MLESLLAPSPSEHGARPPRSGRRRAGVLTVLVAGAAALAAAAAGCSSGSSGSAANSAAKHSHTGAPGALRTPARIASLQKAANQSLAHALIKQLKGSAGASKVKAVSYQDSANKSHTVLVYGGTGIPLPPGDPVKQLSLMLRSGAAVSAKIGSPARVDSGGAGGTAECVTVAGTNSAGMPVVNCAWINNASALVMTFQGYQQQNAEHLVPQILAAMIST